MKFVVNTHTSYRKPLLMFFESVKNSDLKREMWKNIIVVDNETDKSEPKLIPVNELVDIDVEETIVHVGNEFNSYDMGAYNILNLYNEHELINDEQYLMIHDTVLLEQNFWETIKKFIDDKFKNKIIQYKTPNSNIRIITNKQVKEYDSQYNRSFTKEEAISLELGIKIKGFPLYQFYSFNNNVDTICLGNAPQRGRKAIYTNSCKRRIMIQEKLGLKKYVLFGWRNEFSDENIKQNKF